MQYMTGHEIDSFEPDAPPGPGITANDQARRRIRRAGHWNANQQMARRWPVGCVALEITQRCNLDCSCCYLSENSEAVKDLPLEEVFRRIELIHRHFGSNTDVQITGGDPTLRNRDELLAIVGKLRDLGMRPTLMTNGIRASRALLEELAGAGLVDVAFHVDTTQRRKGYASESALNAVRGSYIDRARGLPLSVFFNTTVHQGNFHEIPDLVRFFAANAGAVRTASFQLAADTGRGVTGNRGEAITPESVARQIEAGAGTSINFLASLAGHPACNRYAMCLAAGGRLFDAFDDAQFIGRMQSATAHLQLQRNNARAVAKRFLRWLAVNPAYLWPVLGWAGRKAWEMRAGLAASRGRLTTISFLIHDFMGSRTLERERVEACAFKVMTADGPLSMCVHNAKRDHYILQPVKIQTPAGLRFWQPRSGETLATGWAPGNILPLPQNLKRLKGRSRQQLVARRCA